jgi:hypothetical protein
MFAESEPIHQTKALISHLYENPRISFALISTQFAVKGGYGF